MNRMKRPPIISKTDPTKSVPKFGRPVVNQPVEEEPTPVVEEVKVETFVKEEVVKKETVPTPLNLEDFKTKEITVENSITVKIKDNYYKFQTSETKTVPEYATDNDVDLVKTTVANRLNEFLDSQIADLLDSLQ